jgi:hypothetical protein
MKQRITVKELEKLTDAQKGILRDWWKPSEGDFVTGDGQDGAYMCMGQLEVDNLIKENVLPLLSIGQMIQFIQEHKPLLKGISKNRFNQWFVNIDNGMLGYKDELCDALWEATKQLLKG